MTTVSGAAKPIPQTMSERDDSQTRPALDSDATLDRLQQVEGYKVLPPCVLYGKIGQGGMGAVYRGRHLNLDIDVAVKCLKPDLTGEDEQFVVRFRREARSAARINHQNVVRVFDVSEAKGLHYIVMELVQGETARQRVQRKQQLSVGEALEILYHAAMGLGEAHSRGFIHRDVKPDNIMIAQNGQVKVADLGLAKPSGNGAMSMLSGTNVVMGTPQYMPPEQWENTATVTPAADVWALGATLYYLLVGGEAIARDSLPRIMQRIVLQPFPDVREQRGDVPDDVAALIAKATAKAPEDRYADAREMADAISRLQTRRESLRDMRTTVNADHNTLLSPPPAKTLAKIKFWLDEQAQGGGGAVGGEGDAPVGAGGTLVIPAPGDQRGGTQKLPSNAPRRTGVWIATAAVALLAVVLGVWQPWSGGDPFAASERLARDGQYAQAIRAAEAAYASDPSLAGRAERLARLHAGWASVLLDQDRLGEALERIAASLTERDNEPAQALRRTALAKAALRIERDLQRDAPGDEPVPNDAPVTFRGRLGSMLVRALRIAGADVVIAADGSFRADVDVRGAAEAEVVAVLKAGGEVTLRPWSIRRVEAGAPTQDSRPVADVPAVGDTPRNDTARDDVPRDDTPREDRTPAKPTPRPLAQTVTITPTRVELVGGRDGKLTIDAPLDAELFVDGQLVDRGGRARYEHVVSGRAAEPAPVQVRVRRAGEADLERTVAVVRVERALRYTAGPTFVGVQRAGGRWVTADESVQIRGRVNEPADTLLVDGQPAADVQWQGDQFTLTVALPEPGERTIRIEAQLEFCRAAVAELVACRVPPATIALADGRSLQEQVAAARYEVCVRDDGFTARVVAGDVALRRDGETWRGEVPLEVGENVVQVTASNLVGQQAALELRITRLPASAVPELRALSLRRGDELVPVTEKDQLFVRGDAVFVVEASDPAAVVLVDGEPVAVGADGAIDLSTRLVDEAFTALKVQLQNDAGKSPTRTFFAMRDATPPVAEVTSPTGAVAKDRPFELSGTWADGGGLQQGACVIGELELLLSQRGINKQGTWKVTHPGLSATTELEVVVVDRAGNRATVPVRVEVQ